MPLESAGHGAQLLAVKANTSGEKKGTVFHNPGKFTLRRCQYRDAEVGMNGNGVIYRWA
ncbi:hypothetical protein L226DRAFT_268469 [Lentinus tigrinus ALCF2SS1-7]|uniref:uncharacterized protein n=1 Tax=Lentinus tigrinus ALCF2SS1-7 TaxID=1328758 RepID=UPI001165F7C0|nr:hypothetical protein L226DRAFT_268469 [Lentinus tigrinus ALCF2SS1-7]